jgi:hypothetical protein
VVWGINYFFVFKILILREIQYQALLPYVSPRAGTRLARDAGQPAGQPAGGFLGVTTCCGRRGGSRLIGVEMPLVPLESVAIEKRLMSGGYRDTR